MTAFAAQERGNTHMHILSEEMLHDTKHVRVTRMDVLMQQSLIATLHEKSVAC